MPLILLYNREYCISTASPQNHIARFFKTDFVTALDRYSYST